MSPTVAHAIDSLQSRGEATRITSEEIQFVVHDEQKSAFVLYIFRVPGNHDLCLSTFKPHNDVVTALDILLAAYYVRCNEYGAFQVLRGGQCVASLSDNQIEVRLKIDDPAETKNETIVTRKRIDNKGGNFFQTSIEEIDRLDQKKSFVSDANGISPASCSGLNIDQLKAAAARSEKESLQTGFTSTQLIKEKLRTAKRSLASSEFKDQRGQRCMFYPSVTGQDLRCDQVSTSDSSNNSGLPISELRFNLPTILHKFHKKEDTMASSQSSTGGSEYIDLGSFPTSRHKRFFRPPPTLVKNHASNRSDNPENTPPPFSAPLHGSNGFRMSLPEPVLDRSTEAFNDTDVDAKDYHFSHNRETYTSTSDGVPSSESTSSLQIAPPLPPRQQTRSESAVVSEKSFGIKRKALNQSKDAPIPTMTPPLLPPSPPKHDTLQYPHHRPMSTGSAFSARTDSAPPYSTSPELSPAEQLMPPASPVNLGRLDLSLGQEALGGGFRGQQAKLGKLLVFADGNRMLDLVVAANIAMFWRAWKGGNDVAGRVRSGSTPAG